MDEIESKTTDLAEVLWLMIRQKKSEVDVVCDLDGVTVEAKVALKTMNIEGKKYAFNGVRH